MAIQWRTAAVAIAATAGLAASAAAGERAHTLVVQVENLSDITAASIALARWEVERVFEGTGVTLRWVDVGASDAAAAEALRIRIILLSRMRADRLLAGEKLSKHVLGLASEKSHRIYVFTDRIARFAATIGGDLLRILLGRVIAHELGHVLLPGQGHTEAGIMHAAVEADLRKAVAFTPEQREAIRARLADYDERRVYGVGEASRVAAAASAPSR